VTELGEALRLIFEKIGAFFDILDLSFFVSGGVALAALWMWSEFAGFGLQYLDGWLQVLVVLLGSYVAGLVCFAGGRWLRVAILEWGKDDLAAAKELEDLLHAHDLVKDPAVANYIATKETHRGIKRLHVRMWAAMRKSKELANSLAFINRYWVMAATYDGLGFALMLWSSVVLLSLVSMGPIEGLSGAIGIPALVFLLFAAFGSFREARRLVDYQVEELVAAIAAYRNKW
jgi:hypothetical protein